MAEAAKDATQLGATDEVIDQVDQQTAVAAPVQTEPTARELEMDRIERENAKRLGVTLEPEKVEAPAAEAAPVKEDAKPIESTLDAAAQLSKQLEDGTIVLDEALLSKAMVRTKVDGKEELVPASKALGQYQKGAAADVRLAEATRMSKEAADLLRAAETKAAPAITAADKLAAAEQEVKNAETLRDLRKQYVDAMYSGDDEKAGQLFDQMTDIRVQAALATREPAQPQVDVNAILQQAVPALKQQLSVDSALDKLFADYPEIKADPDYTLLADVKRESYEAQGKSRAEAIALAGEELGKKYGLGSFAKKDVKSDGGLTTREQKLAAKERLDEPAAAAARATNSSAQRIPSASEVIAEMAASRGQRAA